MSFFLDIIHIQSFYVYFEKQLYTVHQLPSPCTIGFSKELIFLIKDLFNARNNPLVYWHFWFFSF